MILKYTPPTFPPIQFQGIIFCILLLVWKSSNVLHINRQGERQLNTSIHQYIKYIKASTMPQSLHFLRAQFTQFRIQSTESHKICLVCQDVLRKVMQITTCWTSGDNLWVSALTSWAKYEAKWQGWAWPTFRPQNQFCWQPPDKKVGSYIFDKQILLTGPE